MWPKAIILGQQALVDSFDSPTRYTAQRNYMPAGRGANAWSQAIPHHQTPSAPGTPISRPSWSRPRPAAWHRNNARLAIFLVVHTITAHSNRRNRSDTEIFVAGCPQPIHFSPGQKGANFFFPKPPPGGPWRLKITDSSSVPRQLEVRAEQGLLIAGNVQAFLVTGDIG